MRRFGRVLQWIGLITLPVAMVMQLADGAVLIFLGTLRPPGERGGIASSKPLVFLGRISYSLYVFHHLAVYVVHLYAGHSLSRLGFFASSAAVVLLALPLTIALGASSYYLIELPFLRWKRRFTYVESRPDGVPVRNALPSSPTTREPNSVRTSSGLPPIDASATGQTSA